MSTKFCKGCTKEAKVHSEVENNLQSLLEGLQMKKWTMGRKIGVSLVQELDVSNFLKDVPRIPKSILKWGPTSNHFLRMFKGINGPWEGR